MSLCPTDVAFCSKILFHYLWNVSGRWRMGGHYPVSCFIMETDLSTCCNEALGKLKEQLSFTRECSGILICILLGAVLGQSGIAVAKRSRVGCGDLKCAGSPFYYC